MAYYLEAYLVEEAMDAPLETVNSFGIRESIHLPIYDSVRAVLRPEYKDLSDTELHALLSQVLGEMSPEEVEGFWDTVKSVGKSALGVAKQAAPAVLPAAGGALGTFVGGPVGTAIGSKLGQMGAQLLTQPQKPSTPAPAAPAPADAPGIVSQPVSTAPTPGAVAAPVPAGGTSATAQLLALIKNPELLKSLLGRLLGGAGESTVVVGPRATPIPFGAMMNALEALAAQAALEAAEALDGEDDLEAVRRCPRYCSGRSLSAKARQRCLRLCPELRTRRMARRPQEAQPAEPGYRPQVYGEEPYRDEPYREEPYGETPYGGNGGSFESMGYLQDESGSFVADPANPDERAQRVLELLRESGEAYAPEPYDPVTEWLIEAELL